MINKVLFAIAVVFICFESPSANCQISGRKVLYNFEQPYFMGNGFSNFLGTRIIFKKQDWNREIDGNSVLTFKLTKNNEIKNLVVVDSTTNDHFNKQVYDAIADYPGSWQVGLLNHKPVDLNIIVTVKLARAVNTYTLYSIIGDYEYLVDNLLSDNFYQEGVKASEENKFKEAIKYFDEVIGFSAEEVDALYSRGICKYKSDDKAGACEDWKKIQSSGKPDADKLILKYCVN